MKFRRIMEKCTWQDYRTDEDILSELEINSVVKKIQNYRITTCSVNGHRQTSTLSHEYQPCGRQSQG
jgi:hypothetical protein